MGTPNEYKALERYCICVGINICCQHTQIGDSIGVDFDADAAAAVVVADARNLPFKAGSLDYAISHHGLEHMRDAPLFVLHEWLRVLRLGGTLAVIVPDGGAGESALNYASFSGQVVEGGHGHLFTREALRTLVQYAGGDVEECSYLTHPDRTGRSILVVATKSRRHEPFMTEFSTPVEVGRMIQKQGLWRCIKRAIWRLRCG
jgi:SAM-dependent methyltransferase